MVRIEYGVTDTNTGIVFAKAIWVSGRIDKPKINNVKVGIVDYFDDHREILKVVNCNLSSSKGVIEKSELLEPASFIVVPSEPYKGIECDYVFLSKNPKELIEQLESK